jgi:anaerobic magnesium-protoporphyrin IX monomethyl ester cyclase
VDVGIVQYSPIRKERVLERIRDSVPIIVGFSLIFQRMLDDFNDLISYLRSNDVKSHFTMGGHFPTLEYYYILSTISGLDSIIRCEGEETLVELYKSISSHADLTSIAGLVFRKNGHIVKTPSRSLISNLDLIPFPLRSEKPIFHRKIGLATLVASRGCNFNCSFCSIHQFYKDSVGVKRRSRTPQNVLDEMQILYNKFQVTIFIFEDDDFMRSDKLKQAWITEFIEGLKQRELNNKIIWRISCRIDEVDHDLIKMMSEAGLISVYLGIESGNEEGLKYYNKKYKLDDIYKSIDILIRLSMPFEFGFMLLNPETTFESIQRDIEFLKYIGNLGEAVVHFTKMLPYAGTPVSKKLLVQNRLKGTVSIPDYTYIDSRLDWLQHFFTIAFHHRNFESSGLVERLRFAKLDSIILDKYYTDKYDTKRYKQAINQLIKAANLQCVETMGMMTHFMSQRSEKQIIDEWNFVQYVMEEELRAQRIIELELENLMNQYDK